MHIKMTPEVREQMERWRLVCCCEECANFVADVEQCALLYPATPHRRGTLTVLRDDEPLLFCKMFEAT